MSTAAEAMKRRFAAKLLALIGTRVRNQAELVKRSGLHQNTIRRLSVGEGNPYFYQAVAIAQACDVPLEWLASDSEALPEPTDDWETLVRQAADRLGWERVYWKIMGADHPVDREPPRPRETAYGEVRKAAKQAGDAIKKKGKP